MPIAFSGNGLITTANATFSGTLTSNGNLSVATIQSKSQNTAPTIADSSGTEVGQFAKAWVNFYGANGTIRSSFNVSSVTYITTGTYTVNFTNALQDGNYCFVTAAQRDSTGALVQTVASDSTGVANGSIKLFATYGSSSTLYNPTSVNIAVFR